MNILVIGRGWTGNKVFNELVNRGHLVTFCSNAQAVEALYTNKYVWAVNCAGVTGNPNVDACESDKRNTIYGNAVFPVLLADACARNFVRLAHFSSGCIYQGEINDVNAEPNYFGSIYSVAKGVSDAYLGDKAQVYRIRMPFTGAVERKNYLMKVYNYAKSGKLVDFGQNSITDLDEAVRVACDLIEADDANGYYNLVNKGSINMHELADLMGINPQWYTPEEFKQVTVAARSTCVIPAYEGMSDVREALTKAITKIRNA